MRTPFAELEVEVAKRVDQLWPVIVEFAEELHKRQSFDAVEALEFIKPRLGKKVWFRKTSVPGRRDLLPSVSAPVYVIGKTMAYY